MSGLSSEQGVTLVELLIGMLITAVLIIAIGGSLLVGVNTTEAAGRQVNEASWARVASNWFLTDVHGANDDSLVARCLDPSGGPSTLLRSFLVEDEPEVSPPSTTTTTTTTIGPSTTTTTTIGTTTTTTEPTVTTHYVEWWRQGGGDSISVVRTTCTVTTPLPDPPDPAYPPTSEGEVATDLSAVTINCSSSTCTLSWVGSESGETYQLTARKRIP